MVVLRFLALAYAAIAIALAAARPVATAGPLARDFEAYWSAGVTANAGDDPYSRRIWKAESSVAGVDRRRDEVLPFIGPPATLLVWRPLARLPYAAAAALWLTLLTIALLGLILGALYGSRERITPTSFLAATALAIAFGPITSDLALGQIALLAFAAATFFVTLVDRSLLAAAGAAVLAFAQPNLALGLTSQLGRVRALLAIAGGAAVTYGLGALALGLAWPLRYASAGLAHGAAERFVAIQITPAAVAYGFGLPPNIAWTFGIAVAAVALAAGVALVFRVREPFARFAGCSALVPFVAAFVHEHDLLVAYVAALVCALRTRGATRVVGFSGTLLVCIDWLGLAQRPSGVGQSALLALAAAAGVRAQDRALSYTTQQSEAGRTAYLASCAMCHGPHL
ncbi:MAG TPA: glycosyltransferase 87 family protein, partial [Candidatus Cybelea sp.]